MTGLLTFLDPPRDDTKETIRTAQEYGVPVRMITGKKEENFEIVNFNKNHYGNITIYITPLNVGEGIEIENKSNHSN